MQITPHQDAALKAVDEWINDYYLSSKPKKKWFYLAGYAGTGKTTLARHFAENVDGDVVFAAFTGKAALMMRKNGCFNARTIHSLIYRAQEHDDGTVTYIRNEGSDAGEAKLIIIDECSMVDDELAKDLLSFGKPILVLGDPAQLPPVNGEGFFTRHDSDVMLTEIHRQARDNPIIHLATQIRMGNDIKVGDYGESRVILKAASADAINAGQIICGRNATRTNLNAKMRKMLGYDSIEPLVDEKLICLKNDRDHQIMNGGIFTVNRVVKKNFPTNFIFMSLKRDDTDGLPVVVKVHKSFFHPDVSKPDWRMLKGSQEFCFAYAITAHKAQGSQWDTGLVYDESWCFRDDSQKWLYTALTRFQEKVTLVKG